MLAATAEKWASEWKNPLLLVSRVLLALVFVVAGIGKITGFSGAVGYIASAGVPMPEVMAVIAIIFELGGGVALLFGYHSRIAAKVLIIFTLVATLIFHTDFSDQMQQVQFLKNLAVIGGLLQIYVHGCQAWRVPWQR
jgi:putative oxidoreductase